MVLLPTPPGRPGAFCEFAGLLDAHDRGDRPRARVTQGGGGTTRVRVNEEGGDLSKYIFLKSDDSSSLSKMCLH